MVPAASRVDPFDLIVFGGAGDLALRKLMPALYHRELDEQIPEACRIVAAARGALCATAATEPRATASPTAPAATDQMLRMTTSMTADTCRNPNRITEYSY